MFDSLNIQVFTNANATFGTSELGYRVFENMTNSHEYYRIATANTTQLASNLNITDSNIYVVNSSLLPAPGTNDAIPGVVFINGEKIIYWGKDDTHNVLYQIRRAVDGTASRQVHLANAYVTDSSIQQALPVNTATTRTFSVNTSVKTTGNVSTLLKLNGVITSNIGDYITQGNANVRVLQSVVSANAVAVISIANTISTSSNTVISINGNVQTVYPTATSIIGTVNSAGNVTITANTSLYADTAWESLTGNGLAGSTSVNAQFIQSSPSYLPTNLD
jgi:hypothetical protein